MKKVSQQAWGLFQKELQIQSHFRFNILHRILIGPVISALTAGLLYSGFFRADAELSLEHMTHQTYQLHLIYAFLIHTLLNSGYYFLSTKLLNERLTGTLPLLWLAPIKPWLLLGSLISVEGIRCAILASVSLLLAFMLSPLTLSQLILATSVFFLFFLLGIFGGLLRTLGEILVRGSAQLFDNVYMLLLFTGCLYIPKSLLPHWLQPICQWNPIHQGYQLLVSTPQLSSFFSLAGAVLLSLSGIFLLIRTKRLRLAELSFG